MKGLRHRVANILGIENKILLQKLISFLAKDLDLWMFSNPRNRVPKIY